MALHTLEELLLELGLGDLNLDGLVHLLVVSSFVVGVVLDGGGEEGVDEGGLAQARLAGNHDSESGTALRNNLVALVGQLYAVSIWRGAGNCMDRDTHVGNANRRHGFGHSDCGWSLCDYFWSVSGSSFGVMENDAAQSFRREIGTGKGVFESAKDLLGDGRRNLVVCWILVVSAWTKRGRVWREIDVGCWYGERVPYSVQALPPPRLSLRAPWMGDHLPSSEGDAVGVVYVWAAREVWV